jgi:hypothetical protein
MNSWQPISSAPKDGRELLLLVPGGNYKEASRLRVVGHYLSGGWFAYNVSGREWSLVRPTHWLPLSEGAEIYP